MEGEATRGAPLQAIRSALSPAKVGGLYVIVGLVVLFSLWVPETFPQFATVAQILNGNAILGLIALSLLVPMSAGVFDISGPYTMSLAGVMVASLIVDSGWPPVAAVIAVVLMSAVIGLVNGFIIVVLKIDSLIATLAVGFLLTSVVLWRTGNKPVNGPELTGFFQQIARFKLIGGLTLPVFYVVGVALVLWFVMEHRAVGRRIYATGFNREAARLAGVRTERIRFAVAVVSSTLAGFAGVVLGASLGAGAPSSGLPYLLPAFAAVFLGATQVRPGRMNVGGTIIAILILGTLTTGLGLAQVSLWAQQMASGLVLIGALALSGYEARRVRRGSQKGRGRRRAG